MAGSTSGLGLERARHPDVDRAQFSGLRRNRS